VVLLVSRKKRRTEKSQILSGKGSISPEVPGMLDEALQHHQAGRLAEAEQLYKKILAVDPQHADTLHLLGILAHDVGRHDVAVELIRQAIAVRRDVAFYHNSLANVLKDHGKLSEAAEAYKHALMLSPGYADALNNLGVTLKLQGKLDEAATCYRRAIALKPDMAEVHNNLGNILKEQGKFEDSIACFEQALALKPDYAEAHYNLGNAFKSQDRLDDAVACFERAIAKNPNHVMAYFNLGNTLADKEKPDEARASFAHAIALKPDYVEAYVNMGNVLRSQYKLFEANACYQQAISLNPGFVEAYINLGKSLHSLDQFDDAIRCYERALALRPDSTDTLNDLGRICAAQGKTGEAIAFYRRALALKPEMSYVHANILLTMVYMASVSPLELAATAREFGQRFADPLLRPRPFVRNTDPERKLRIGYVSYDFHEHPVSYFVEPLFRLHDRSRFELFAYTCSTPAYDDRVTARLRQNVEHWRNIFALSDDETADMIKADAIDILVDLAGHTAGNRLLAFARKPAPVQVTWLGYPATTGMAAMDYRITDSYAEPPGMTEHLNTETLWRLPEIFCCYQTHENSPVVIDHPPFEDNGYITFGCFNNFSKVTDPVLAAWEQIMAQVPESRLLIEILGIDNPQFRASVEARLQRLGLALDRVILEPRKRANQFVLYNKIDIALDPFPCNGGTTSFDTMWMGVPFITLAGKHFVSRMGVTILTNAGLPELIARNIDEYIGLATGLALDKDRLRRLRHNLRDRIAKSPLMDQTAFARNMEAAYREMWRKWCDSVRA
jgi:protein O-GlcNAc transferase